MFALNFCSRVNMIFALGSPSKNRQSKKKLLKMIMFVPYVSYLQPVIKDFSDMTKEKVVNQISQNLEKHKLKNSVLWSKSKEHLSTPDIMCKAK